MCGCQAHHTKGAVCTCWCPPEQHVTKSTALHEQRTRWDDAQKPPELRILPTPGYLPEERP